MEGYPIAVNGDIRQNDVDFIDEPDPLISPSGQGNRGKSSWSAQQPRNAVFHATGTAFRTLPIHIEDVPTIL